MNNYLRHEYKMKREEGQIYRFWIYSFKLSARKITNFNDYNCAKFEEEKAGVPNSEISLRRFRLKRFLLHCYVKLWF